MRTPAGVDCPYFYGDYFRGKNLEECRLIGNRPPPQNWTPDLCTSCPVPSIKRANNCENMQLNAVISKKFILLKRQVKVTAYCSRAESVVDKPEIGCGFCHPVKDKFKEVEQ